MIMQSGLFFTSIDCTGLRVLRPSVYKALMMTNFKKLAAITSERNERLRTLIFFDELKQFFEQMEEKINKK
jgi:hypothetical protein